MDRLRRSLRDSFRKRKDHVPECSKPHQWQADEAAVRAGTCNFPVKYLGCVEVFDSRGMQVCEEALRLLRNSRRRPVKGVLYVTGDGLRVVDEDTKGLIVDQTIEKVSFCAPDRNHEKGFSYICRDGTTRRWMCHGFLAVKDSGERLSHAVGCAFAACLERKQKRDKECGVTMTFDPNGSAFTRTGSFRQTSLTERMQDPQECKPFDPPPPKNITNPFAIERPHATPMMLERQGSFRGFNQLQQASPFKRQLSLRVNDLPSNLERQQKSLSSRPCEKHEESPSNLNGLSSQPVPVPGPASPQLPPRIPRNRLHSLPNTAVNMSPIPESSPTGDRQPDTIRAMCQQVTEGLSMLCSTDDPFTPSRATSQNTRLAGPSVGMNNHVAVESFEPIIEQNTWKPAKEGASRAEAWLASNVPSHISVSKSSSNPLDLFGVARTNGQTSPHSPSMVTAPPRKAPHLSHLRSQSLGASADPHVSQAHPVQSPPSIAMARYSGASVTFQSQSPSQRPEDPFDAGWVNLPPTNPFQQNSVKAFEVHL